MSTPVLLCAVSSAYMGLVHLCNPRVPPAKRLWASADAEPAMAEILFDGVYDLSYLSLLMAGSDMTSDQSEIYLFGITPEGDDIPIALRHNVLINRGGPTSPMGLSCDGPNPPRLREGFQLLRDVEGPLALSRNGLGLRLPELPPLRGVGFLIKGHGWFAAMDLACEGAKVRDFTLEEKVKFYTSYEDPTLGFRIWYADPV